MEKQYKKQYIVTGQTAILHNGQRYVTGDRIELSDAEYANLSIYVQRDAWDAEQEKQRLAQERAAKAKEQKEQEEAAKKSPAGSGETPDGDAQEASNDTAEPKDTPPKDTPKATGKAGKADKTDKSDKVGA